MQFSKFGTKFTAQSGILQLMDDLGAALATGDKLMLGGGNPAHIPEVEQELRDRMNEILKTDHAFEKMIGDYDSPQGDEQFIAALAELFQKEYGWDISPANIALTNGSQTSFFYLFNLFAGEFEGGLKKRILLPLAAEYIGYTDAGVLPDFFVSSKPTIKYIDQHTFKYYIDFDHLKIDETIGAICVSRPTNPTGNVLTNEEVDELRALAKQHEIPLILDNAYGVPFPYIIFTEAQPVWDENTVVCMSLSKIGLPAVRCGIIIAKPEIIKAVSAMNAIIGLAPTSVGPALATGMVKSGKILKLAHDVVKPYYESKMKQAVAWFQEALGDLPYYIHKPEGALFLWLWFQDLPITSQELYERLKNRGTLIVPGHHFFPGFKEDWKHTTECIRVNYSQNEQVVRKGIATIADELKKIYGSE